MINFSEASERNKSPILKIIKIIFKESSHVLEIGSGSGQHAIHFGKQLPHLTWQPSDVPGNARRPVSASYSTHPNDQISVL